MSRHDETQLFSKIASLCSEWWGELQDADPRTGETRKGGTPDRAGLARLRRLGTIEGAAGEEIDLAVAAGITPYLDLRRRLAGLARAWSNPGAVRFARQGDAFDDSVAVVAATLSRVRRDTGEGRTAALLGAPRKTGDEQPLMAEARFKRLIRTRSAADLLAEGRHIVALLGRDAPVGDLGASLLLWNAGPRVIRDWSFAYYGAAEADRDPVEDASTATETPSPATPL